MKTKKDLLKKVFKIRCSAIGDIMTEPKNAITEKQLLQIKELQAKKEMTDKQKDTLFSLICKRDNPELSQTTKGYCKNWLKSQMLNRKLEFTSKYTDKGIIMEDTAIDFIAEYLKLGMLFKNEISKEDDYMMGTNDVDIPNLIIDIKNSWSWETFPLLELKLPEYKYWWQMQGYLHLFNKNRGKVIYVLSDTPQHLIEREARNYCFFNGYEEMDMDIYNEFHKKLTYQDLPDNYKIKIFDVEKDKKSIEKVKKRVIECRKYIETLIKELDL